MIKRPVSTAALGLLALSAPAFAAIPTGVTCAAAFETNGADKFTLPLWFG